MKKTIVIAHLNTIDEQGDMILSGAVTKKEVPLRRDFKGMPIGKVENIREEGNNLVADIITEAEVAGTTLYPAIGFTPVKTRLDENNIRVIEELNLYEVSLCHTPNADPDITPINVPLRRRSRWRRIKRLPKLWKALWRSSKGANFFCRIRVLISTTIIVLK